jgi:magnesium chelatase subunit D
LLETIRAAAPWQKLRGAGGARLDPAAAGRFARSAFRGSGGGADDLRGRCFGFVAAARLAEAKGAVELLLGRAYAKRAEVALIAFRGSGAELLLPPTRSLTRARRLLAELPGGGGTPLAAGLDAAGALADAARRRGRTPFLLLLTDGRANVGSDGTPGRAARKRMRRGPRAESPRPG